MADYWTPGWRTISAAIVDHHVALRRRVLVKVFDQKLDRRTFLAPRLLTRKLFI